MADVHQLPGANVPPRTRKPRQPREPKMVKLRPDLVELALEACMELEGIFEIMQREFRACTDIELEWRAWTGLALRASQINDELVGVLGGDEHRNPDDMRRVVLGRVEAERFERERRTTA